MKNKFKFIALIFFNAFTLLVVTSLAMSLDGKVARLGFAGCLLIILWLIKIHDLIVAQSIRNASIGNTRFLLLAEHLKMDCVDELRAEISLVEEHWEKTFRHRWIKLLNRYRNPRHF